MDWTWESFVLLGAVVLSVVAFGLGWIVPGFMYNEAVSIVNRLRDHNYQLKSAVDVATRTAARLSLPRCRCGCSMPEVARYCPRCGRRARGKA